MIIGHYGVAFLVSKAEPRLPLWQPMVAVVWLDILHSSLVLVGVEQAVVVPGITAAVPIDLRYYPYSHSLAASLLWSLATFALYRLGSSRSPRIGALMGLAVFSHFVLDFIAHRPDLPLLGGEPKFGLGLWNHIAATFVAENALLFGALALYQRSAPPGGGFGARHGMLITAVLGSALFFSFPYVPFPDDVRYTEAFALAVYVAVAAIARVCQPAPNVTPGEGVASASQSNW